MAVQGPTSGIPEGKTIRRCNDQFEKLWGDWKPRAGRWRRESEGHRLLFVRVCSEHLSPFPTSLLSFTSQFLNSRPLVLTKTTIYDTTKTEDKVRGEHGHVGAQLLHPRILYILVLVTKVLVPATGFSSLAPSHEEEMHNVGIEHPAEK